MPKLKRHSKEFRACFSPHAMRLAWERYLRSTQKEAKDYMGIRSFRSDLEANLKTLSEIVLGGEYYPSRPPKYYKPKASGMQRTITILPVADAIVYQAIANSIATAAYDLLAENNDFVYGSVLHDEVAQGFAVLANPKAELFFFKPWTKLYKRFADSVNEAIAKSKVKFKFETDITGFYDSIPHYNLLEAVEKCASTPHDLLDMLGGCLNIWCGTRSHPTPGVGIPQASIASHFFANVLLHDFDIIIRDTGLPYYRYMDDIRIYGYDEKQLMKALIKVDSHLQSVALSLNTKKTRLVSLAEEEQDDSLIHFTYTLPFVELSGSGESSAEFLSLAMQEGALPDDVDTSQYLINRRAMSALCRLEIAAIKNKIAVLADKEQRESIDFNDRGVQREYIHLAYRFRIALGCLRDLGLRTRIPGGKVLAGWLFLADRLFWLINQFCWVLRLYEKNAKVKRILLDLALKYEDYEWVQSEVLFCLAASQEFTPKEIRGFYGRLEGIHSWYLKRSLYPLLLRHCDDQQLFRSIRSRILREEDGFLQRELLLMGDLWKSGQLTKKQLSETFGIE